jgi:hypothetical protein
MFSLLLALIILLGCASYFIIGFAVAIHIDQARIEEFDGALSPFGVLEFIFAVLFWPWMLSIYLVWKYFLRRE